MTFQKINPDDALLQTAFSSKERPYMWALINRTNALLALILTKQATKLDRLEYHALKWALKELGAFGKDNLEKMQR